MPGRMTTPLRDIVGRLEQQTDDKLQVLVDTLIYVGERCVEEARLHGSYTDRTGNLRSSIGYALLRDGKVIQQQIVEKTKNGDEGASEGAKFLQSRISLAKQRGLVLIVTAGMNYAEYVEATGRNVLSSAELRAPQITRSILSQLGFKVKS